MPVTPFDYHHEKTALVALARWLSEEGWDDVRLSVPVSALDPEAELGGVPVPTIDDAFIEQFNTDATYRYTFYRDEPGRIDLVAPPGPEDARGRGEGQERG